MLFYQAALPLSSRTLNVVARLIRSHRVAIGSRWRRLDAGQQALMTLVYLRQGETYANIAAGFGSSTATVARRVNETIHLLAATANGLRTQLRRIKRRGDPFVIVDSTLIVCDRLAADEPYYSGKHRRHGMNLQAITDTQGNLLWISGASPGAVHDTRAARIWLIPHELRQARLPALADKGYQGLDKDNIATPWKGTDKPQYKKDYNRLHNQLRGPGERAFAQLKKWRLLRKLRCDPHRAATIARAIAVLNQHEQKTG